MFKIWRLRTITSSSLLGSLAAACIMNQQNKKGSSLHCKVTKICEEFKVTNDDLIVVMNKLTEEILMGLNPATKGEASTKCWPTYVQDLPSQEVVGDFLALDLGGTNFRVLLISLKGKKFDMKSKIYAVPEEKMTGTGEELFDHIADCLASFTKDLGVNRTGLPLGFTFSFPCQQTGLNQGVLQRWTKGFNASGVVGEDVVDLLNKAIKKRDDLEIDVVALLNDTTGTLMSCGWKDKRTKIGLILGTGTNACYVEKIDNIPGFDGNLKKPFVIVNIEWGAFGDHGELEFLRTPFDAEVDGKSPNPGEQIFEKMISGMYLGEIVRLVIVKLTKDRALFKGQLPEKLKESNVFLTSFISDIEKDNEGCFKNTKKVFEKLRIKNYTEEDLAGVRHVAECVSRRSAYLASAGVATVLNKIGCPLVTVGVDGSLYRHHPHFHNIMTAKIKELVRKGICFQLMLSEDGSGRGAALVAAALSKPLPDSNQ